MTCAVLVQSGTFPCKASLQLHSGVPHLLQVSATAGHQHQRCSAPASPSPHRGHGPCGETRGRTGPRHALALLMPSASSRKGSGSESSGRDAQHSPCDHCPAHSAHQAVPIARSPSAPSAGVVQAMATRSVPHEQHLLGTLSSSFLHRARPGRPLYSRRITLPASVMPPAAATTFHSPPSPGDHLRFMDLACFHLECLRK